MSTDIVPVPDPLTEPYWQGLREGELRIQHCRACDARWHPPLPICPECLGNAVEWQPVCGRGTLHTYTVVHHAVHPALLARVPYVVALVDLSEGPRVVTNIVGVEAEDLRIGMPVRLILQDLASGDVLAQFTACRDGSPDRS
jgi:uncharacterized protein